jgi:hypothetical protein
MTRFIVIPAFVIWIVGLLIQHTVQSIALAFGLAALLSLSVFHMVTTIQLRREHHQGWFTGRTLKSN